MVACQYCGKDYKYIKGHESKCKAYYDEAAKSNEAPSAEDVLAARKMARVKQLEAARSARAARSVESKKEKAREILAENAVVAEAVPEPEPESVPQSPQPVDWNSMY